MRFDKIKMQEAIQLIDKQIEKLIQKRADMLDRYKMKALKELKENVVFEPFDDMYQSFERKIQLIVKGDNFRSVKVSIDKIQKALFKSSNFKELWEETVKPFLQANGEYELIAKIEKIIKFLANPPKDLPDHIRKILATLRQHIIDILDEYCELYDSGLMQTMVDTADMIYKDIQRAYKEFKQQQYGEEDNYGELPY